jgi:hypothetical protein
MTRATAEKKLAVLEEARRRYADYSARVMSELPRPAEFGDWLSEQRHSALHQFAYLMPIASMATSRHVTQEREGYAVVWVNDVEMMRADKAIKAIKERAIADEPKLAPANDEVWDKALQSLQGQRLFPQLCQRSLTQLYGMSPVPTHTFVKP